MWATEAPFHYTDCSSHGEDIESLFSQQQALGVSWTEDSAEREEEGLHLRDKEELWRAEGAEVQLQEV